MPPQDAQSEMGSVISRQDVSDRLNALDRESVQLRAQIRGQQERGGVEGAGRQLGPLQVTQAPEIPPTTESSGTGVQPVVTTAEGTAPALDSQANGSALTPVLDGFPKRTRYD